jgi:predicted permease
MNLFETILPPLTQVVFLVAVGMVCRVKGILSNQGTGEISKLILNVTLPIMLFVSGAQSDVAELARQGPLVFLAGIMCPVLGFGIGALIAWLFKLPPRQATIVRVGASLSNTAFVGIPVCAALWGAQGALLAAIYDQGINFPLLLLAPLAYGKAANKNLWKELLLAPMVWGLALGILWNIAGIGLASWLATPLGVIGNVTFPLSLVMIGALAIPDQIETNIARPLIAFLSARLLVVPIIIWTIALALGWHGVGVSVMILQTAMPASVTATVMAREYGAEANLAASGAMFSVLFSLATIPLIAMLVLGI